MKYTQLIEDEYLYYTRDIDMSKLEFISDYIFDITTYDTEMSEKISSIMIEVLECILNKKTFEYIEDNEKYYNYLMMVNIPFLKQKIEWGTSVRGAWFNVVKEIEICYIIIKKNEFEDFIKELIEWVKI